MYRVKEILKIVKGKLISNLEDSEIKKISTDTRKDVKDALFIPIVGENFDGHDFIKEAYKKGAVASLTQKKLLPDFFKNLILVDDTLKAYGLIANNFIKKKNIKTIAITGTSGKTSVKDMLAFLTGLPAPEKSFNNLIGVPETILTKGRENSYLILEFGTNKRGEIYKLTEISEPIYAVITNIGYAHLEGFKNINDYIEEKLDLIKKSKRLKKAVVFWDNEFIKQGLKDYDDKKLIKVRKSDIINFKNYENYSYFKIKFKGNIYEVKSPLIGFHNAINFLLCIYIATEIGFNSEKLIKKIENFKPPTMRFEIIKTKKGFLIINDCYNANFESFKAAFESFKTLPKKNRKIAVIGDILELGDYSEKIHKKIGELINHTDIDIVFGIGKDISTTINAINGNRDKRYFNSKKDIVETLKKTISKDDLILFKASRKMELENIIEEII